MCIAHEKQMKEALHIQEWGQLTSKNILDYIKLLPNVQKHLHLKVFGDVPEMAGKIGNVMGLIQSTINESAKLSSETKAAYSEIVKALQEMLKKPDLSREEQERIFDELVKISSFINMAGQEDAELFGRIAGEVLKTAAIAVLAVGLFLGGKALAASLL